MNPGTTYTSNGDGTFTGGNHTVGTKNEDHVVNNNEQEAMGLRDSWNEIFLRQYGETPFYIETKTRKDTKDGKAIEYTVYVIKGSIGFDWEQHQYTRMLRDILESSEDITVDFVQGDRAKWLDVNRGGGETINSNRVEVSSNCIDDCAPNRKRRFWTKGGVALHELLWHIHNQSGMGRDSDTGKGESHITPRKYFNTRIKNYNTYHPVGPNQNKNIKSTRFKNK